MNHLIGGIDFSGARGSGGRRKRVVAILASEVDRGRPRLLELERGWSYAALVDLIANRPGSWWGLDVPFGIPRAIAKKLGYVGDGFAGVCRLFRGWPNPAAFRDELSRWARVIQPGRRELPRRTDLETQTPFCVNNLWIYKQTYFGIRECLCPLSRRSHVAILPWSTPGVDGRNTAVLETCPASFLKPLGLYRPYKGRDAVRRAQRAAILDALRADGLDLPGGFARAIVADAEADLLDAVLCAVITWRCRRLPPAAFAALRRRYGHAEGVVFSGSGPLGVGAAGGAQDEVPLVSPPASDSGS